MISLTYFYKAIGEKYEDNSNKNFRDFEQNVLARFLYKVMNLYSRAKMNDLNNNKHFINFKILISEDERVAMKVADTAQNYSFNTNFKFLLFHTVSSNPAKSLLSHSIKTELINGTQNHIPGLNLGISSETLIDSLFEEMNRQYLIGS